ncbi:hypothetical protein Pcinc_044353 [Petrolisthes cinctipes]|uniref:Endonuclease/exonuclease/phosphatase domain-containing protein n=1 Tax=Petrolisthes cinctipes TaxID=88211 RepID=A0AAE1BF28_PETCI|nr:hypothetical protein Pcinc_044353 [Petrolisthes cinctipes]
MRSPHLTVLSANVRGLRTNIGDLTHNFILRHRTDIAVVTETWLTSEVGSSDHHAILTKTEVGVAREDAISRTIWLWDRADWSSLRRDLQRTDWGAILTGSADAKARAFTERLKASQHQHVPHRQYTSRPTDQPWFGTSRMWNVFTAAAPSMQDLSIQQVKVAAHRWRGTLPTPISHI